MEVKVSPRLLQLLDREEEAEEVLSRLWRELREERQAEEPKAPQSRKATEVPLPERVRFSYD